MKEKMKQAVLYFKSESVFHELFVEFRKKYESLGRIGGTVQLKGLQKDELEPLSLFFGKSVKHAISLLAFEKQLQKTKFEGVGLHELLEAYFGEPIRSKKSVIEEVKLRQDKALTNYTTEYPNLALYFHYLKGRSPDTHWIFRIFDEFEKAIPYLSNAVAYMPTHYERLPLFSQKISGNPHLFDLTSTTGKLFIHLLQFKQHGGGTPPSQTEEINELLLSFRILRDDITNFVTFANLLGYQVGKVHSVWQAAFETRSAVNMPLRELLKIDRVKVPNHKSNVNVYIVENSAVFSSLLDEVPNAPLICTHGQFKLAGLQLMDLLVESGHTLSYAGDFDPEGLSIAERLLKRYPGNVKLWQMDVPSYERSNPVVELGERLNKLTSITHSSLQALVNRMLSIGKAGYQEALLDWMIKDLLQNQSDS